MDWICAKCGRVFGSRAARERHESDKHGDDRFQVMSVRLDTRTGSITMCLSDPGEPSYNMHGMTGPGWNEGNGVWHVNCQPQDLDRTVRQVLRKAGERHRAVLKMLSKMGKAFNSGTIAGMKSERIFD